MKRQLLNVFFVWLLITLLAPTMVKAIDSDWGYASVNVGETINVKMSSTMQSILSSPYAINISCIWSSENASIATANQTSYYSCKVTGIKKGNIKIYCNVSWTVDMGYGVGVPNSVRGCVYLTVTEPVKVKTISISPSSSVFLSPNNNVQLKATVYPSNATNKTVTWSSSDTDVVTVDNTGMLKAIDYGNATITCNATDGSGVTATCEVTVADKVPVTDITLSDTLLSLGTESNTGKYLYATIVPDNATDKTVTWSSSNPGVATVSYNRLMDDGRYRVDVDAKAIGSTTITCTANDGSGVQVTCTVNVYKYPDGATFSEKTSEGVEIWYKMLDNSNGTCSVNGVSSNNTGTITIPSVVKGYTVISIGKSAFYSNKSITTVNLPTTVTSIGNEAFYNCTSLTSIKLNNVTYLGEEVFYNCTALSSITGINQMEYIGDNAFYNTPWYDKLPDGPLYLGKVLYRYKGSMPENTIFSVKDGTVSITSGAFANRTIGLFQSDNRHLVSLYIPKSVSNLYGCSSYCPNLERIVIDPANETYDSRNDCNAIIEKSSNTLIAGCKGTVIPETVTAIGERAFEYSGIASVVIPNSVDSIADYVFNGSSLASSEF